MTPQSSKLIDKMTQLLTRSIHPNRIERYYTLPQGIVLIETVYPESDAWYEIRFSGPVSEKDLKNLVAVLREFTKDGNVKLGHVTDQKPTPRKGS